MTNGWVANHFHSPLLVLLIALLADAHAATTGGKRIPAPWTVQVNHHLSKLLKFQPKSWPDKLYAMKMASNIGREMQHQVMLGGTKALALGLATSALKGFYLTIRPSPRRGPQSDE